MWVKSTPKMCKGRDIAVILTEKMEAVDIFKSWIKIILIFISRLKKLASS